MNKKKEVNSKLHKFQIYRLEKVEKLKQKIHNILLYSCNNNNNSNKEATIA